MDSPSHFSVFLIVKIFNSRFSLFFSSHRNALIFNLQCISLISLYNIICISLNLDEICRKHDVTCKMFVRKEFVVRALVIKSPLFMLTFESHFRSGLVPSLRVETSAFVNRFLVATFIMHEKCLPTGPDRNIYTSSVSRRYRNE